METPDCTIIGETELFLVVVKPAGLPTVPLAKYPDTPSLLTQVAVSHPEIVQGVSPHVHEGLILHRLDTDTCGLVLIARDRTTYGRLQDMQRNGLFVKTYVAEVSRGTALDGFPSEHPSIDVNGPISIESRFRAFGSGRRAVRPVVADSGHYAQSKGGNQWYTTTVERMDREEGAKRLFRCILARGFRHQIRSHLAWTGNPIVGDRLYGGMGDETLHLAAVALDFPHPIKGEPMHYEWTSPPLWTRLAHI